MNDKFLKVGDLKLLNIKVMKDDNMIYSGMVEDAPDEIKETHYSSATFDSEFIILNV